MVPSDSLHPRRPCLHLDVVSPVLLTIKAQSLSSRLRIFKTNLAGFRGQHSNLPQSWTGDMAFVVAGPFWASYPWPEQTSFFHAWGTNPCCCLATGRTPVSPGPPFLLWILKKITRPKTNRWNLKIHPVEKENHLTHIHSWVPC